MVDLSVIVPIYNLESFLEDCLCSLVKQNSKYSYEVICINDGSTDRSGEILQSYANEYPKIVRVFNKENEGVSAARNFGISNSLGKYLTFVDGDDWVSEQMVDLSLNLLQSNNYDIAISDTIHVFNDNKIVVEEKIKHFVFNTENHACGKVFKKSLIDKYNLEFPRGIKIGEDLSFTFSYLLICNSYTKTKDPYYYYRRNRSGSIMSNRKQSKYKDIYRACNNLIEFAKKNHKYTLYKEEIEYIFIKNIIVRTLPKIIKNEFPYYKKIKLNIKEQVTFIEQFFPNWKNNQYFRKDVEGYFVEKLGVNYIKNLNGIITGNLFYIFFIAFDRLFKK